MLISAEMKAALTVQIGHEFAAMLQYVTIATYFESEGLPQLAQHFYRQAEEERALGSPTAVLEPDPIQMPWVQEAFHRAANGESLLAVYRWIRWLPVEARGSRAMPYQAVRKLLASPLYVARPLHGEADVLARPAARWPALVDDATWLRVRERVAQHGECRGKLAGAICLPVSYAAAAAANGCMGTNVGACPSTAAPRQGMGRSLASGRATPSCTVICSTRPCWAKFFR